MLPPLYHDVMQTMGKQGAETLHNLMAYSGYEKSTVQRVLTFLRLIGWAERISGYWMLTESGKIGFAIEQGRRTRKRAIHGYVPRSLSLPAFESTVLMKRGLDRKKKKPQSDPGLSPSS